MEWHIIRYTNKIIIIIIMSTVGEILVRSRGIRTGIVR